MKKIFFSLTFLTALLSAGYNQTTAAAYALTYAKNHNPNYKYITGADCTNFISQAMKAGGIKYDYNGNNNYQKWYKYSLSWQYAPTFRLRAKKGGYGALKINRSQLEVGDVIIFDWSGSPYRFQHVTMVTNVTVSFWGTKTYYISYHSTDKKNESLEYVESLSRRVEYYRPRW